MCCSASTRRAAVRSGWTRKKLRVRQPCDAIRGGIFLVPENRHTQGLSLMHSVYDNSLLPLLPMLSKKRFFIDDRQGAQIVQEIIETMQVKTPGSDIAISKLSGGNQQKIVVGKALESHPKILLLDDPTYGVDIHAKGDHYHCDLPLHGRGRRRGLRLLRTDGDDRKLRPHPAHQIQPHRRRAS